MRPTTINTSTLTDDADGIAASQSLGGAGDLTLDGVLVSGGTATASEAQPVTITSSGDDSGITFTISGTDPDGISISETIAGGNATTSTTTAYFKTVTQISGSGATAGTVTSGWLASNGAVTKSIVCNWRQSPFNQALFVFVTGTLTYTVEHTESPPEGEYDTSYATDAVWRDTVGLTNGTSTAESNISFPVRAVRANISTATDGILSFTAIQGQNG